MSVRGRSLVEGSPRFFRRFSTLIYDQQDLKNEAEALAQFACDAAGFYGFDLAQLVALGISNGANIALTSLTLHPDPDAFNGAVLLRPVMALEHPPKANLQGFPVLVVHGRQDPFLPRAEPVTPYLHQSGAEVREVMLDKGHKLSGQDEIVVARWLRELA